MHDTDVIVKIENLTKLYPDSGLGFLALNGISLDIYKGEIFGIVGLSGAGKSTFIRCISCLEQPTSGTIRLNGKDLTQLGGAALQRTRQSIGIISEKFTVLMQHNALSNVCFPMEVAGVGKTIQRHRAEELLEFVGLSDRKKAYPAELTRGQKQRLAVARALATSPKLLLFDGEMSDLDTAGPNGLSALLAEANTRLGVTVVVFVNDVSEIKEICRRVAVFEQGRLVAAGPVQDFCQDTIRIAV